MGKKRGGKIFDPSPADPSPSPSANGYKTRCMPSSSSSSWPETLLVAAAVDDVLFITMSSARTYVDDNMMQWPTEHTSSPSPKRKKSRQRSNRNDLCLFMMSASSCLHSIR